MLVALVEANATQGGDEAVLRGSLRSLANLAFENRPSAELGYEELFNLFG